MPQSQTTNQAMAPKRRETKTKTRSVDTSHASTIKGSIASSFLFLYTFVAKKVCEYDQKISQLHTADQQHGTEKEEPQNNNSHKTL